MPNKNERKNLEKNEIKTNNGKLNYLKTNYSHKRSATSYDYKLIKYILEFEEVKEKKNVLDLACGTATFKKVFETYGVIYKGVDIDNNDEKNNIYKCDIANQDLPFNDQTFDLIFFKMVIEHLNFDEISNCLSEALRVLKPKGKLIVMTPDWEWDYKYFFEEYTHQTPFTISSLKSALKMANFNVDFCKQFIQLPIVWKYPFLKIFIDILSYLYPLAKKNKFIKFCKRRAILAIASKNQNLE